MREPPRITEEDLRACLQDQYDLSSVTLTFLPLGHDYDAGIYRVESEQGTAYALKVTSRPLYEPRCLVPRYLNDQGIASIVAPIPTHSSALWTQLSDWGEKKAGRRPSSCLMSSWQRTGATSTLPIKPRPIYQETSPFTAERALEQPRQMLSIPKFFLR